MNTTSDDKNTQEIDNTQNEFDTYGTIDIIETKYYTAISNSTTITINWHRKNTINVFREDEDTLEPKIFKYDDESLLYYYKKQLHYADEKNNKVIIDNIHITYWSIYDYLIFDKLIILPDADFPLDAVIVSVKNLIDSPIDLFNYSSCKNYYVNVDFCSTIWLNQTHMYLYFNKKSTLCAYNINTFQKIVVNNIQFENTLMNYAENNNNLEISFVMHVDNEIIIIEKILKNNDEYNIDKLTLKWNNNMTKIELCKQ